jgi:surface antigen
MEREDERRIAYALERNEPARWVNQDTGYAYELEPEETYVDRGQQCREFRLEAEIGDDLEEVYGTACRQPDGSWEIADAPQRAAR